MGFDWDQWSTGEYWVWFRNRERETHGKRLGSFLNDEAFDKVSEDLRFDHSLGERSSRVGQGQRECRWSGERDLWSYTDRQVTILLTVSRCFSFTSF